jgi:putative redox protein
MRIVPSSRHSIIAIPGDGLEVSALVRGHVVPTDQPERAGGTDTAPTPLELLTVSLAGCIALYVKKFCDAEGLDAEGVAVEVKPFWREDRYSRLDVTVHLPESIGAEYHARIDEVARTCPVHNTLVHSPEVVIGLQAEPEAAGRVATN